MAFKNAMKMLLGKFGLVWVLLLYLLAAGTVLVCASLPFALPLLRMIREVGIGRQVNELFANIVTGAGLSVCFSGIYSIMQSFLNLVQTNLYAAVNTALLVVLVLGIAYRFVFGLYELPLCYVIDGSMSSNARLGFLGNMIAHLGKSCKFVLCKMLYTLLFDIAFFFLIFVMFDMFYVPVLKMFAPFIIMLVFLAVAGLRYTLIGMWSPAVVDGKKIFPAFGSSVKKGFKYFGQVYSTYVIAVTLIVAFNVPIGLFTFGAGLTVSVPISLLFINLLNMTVYYGKNNKRYYVDNAVITPPETE